MEEPREKAPGISFLLLVTPVAQAADIDAGKARVAAVCAACHGAAGVSVSDSIPNLAAQRAGYLEAQLKALKEGSRKNPIMNAIAAQLSVDDMANVAAYFAAQPGPQTGAKSTFLPNVAATHVTFPEGYKDTFVKYHAINFPATSQVQYYFANKVAAQAAKKEGAARRLGAVRRDLRGETRCRPEAGWAAMVSVPISSFCTRRWPDPPAIKGLPEMLQRGLELRGVHDRQATPRGN
jgi:cytochrome c553